MRIPRLDGIDPVVGWICADSLCTLLRQRFSSGPSELSSEALCWMFMPLLFMVAKRSRTTNFPKAAVSFHSEAQFPYSWPLWIFATCIATVCVYKEENRSIAFFVSIWGDPTEAILFANTIQPALTPLLIAAQKCFRSEPSHPSVSNAWSFSSLISSTWGMILTASFTIFTLSDWSLSAHLWSVIPAIALLIIYIALIPRITESTYLVPLVDIEESIIPLSLRITLVLLSVLGAETALIGFPKNRVASTLILGLIKALSWYFITQAVSIFSCQRIGVSKTDWNFQTRHVPWHAATVIETFSITSTHDPFIQPTELQAFSYLLASFLALSQLINTVPKQAKARSILWTFFLVSLVPYLANVMVLKFAQSSIQMSFNSFFNHPAEDLFQIAKADFESLLQRQSQSYTAAHNEYRRRYSMEPPPGFKAWYEYAKFHQSPIIDDFDTIFDGVSPFWKLSGKEVLEIMNLVHDTPKSELWLCEISGRQNGTRCKHQYRTFDRHIQLLFDNLSEDVRTVLPNVKFLVNHIDEPRVLIPPRFWGRSSHNSRALNLTDLSHRPIFDVITKFCASERVRRNITAKHQVETFGLPFITDCFLARDLCQNPEYSTLHGILMSPTTFRLIENPIPVLSTGSLSTMGDILYPSPAYMESEFQYDSAQDVGWDEKRNNIYWAGSNTGGFASNDDWRYYHRQRFVKFGQNLERQQYRYLQNRNGVIRQVKSPFLNGRLFDIAFTRIFQCKTKSCRDQRAYFKVKSWADKDQALRSRLVYDIDGNGISGRYYKLLASNSLPLKQALLREWHDERLFPWFHHIPISQGMEELPDLALYLTSTEAGQRRAKEVAEQGQKWFSKAFRKVDLSIYTYRMLLELARLQDPQRPAG